MIIRLQGRNIEKRLHLKINEGHSVPHCITISTICKLPITMKQVLQSINVVHKFWKKKFGNSESSIKKFTRPCACKIFMQYIWICTKVIECWLESLYIRKFLFSKYLKLYKFEGFTNPLLLSNFSRTKYLTGHLWSTNLKWMGRLAVKCKWSL